MREICGFWRWPKTWKLERSNRVLKRKLRATHRERSRVPRKTGDGACRNSGSGTVGVERIGSGGKPEACSLFRAKGDLEESSQGLTTCVLLLYCCTSIDIVDGRRAKTKKYVIMTTRPEPYP